MSGTASGGRSCALEISISATRSTPVWVHRCMALRNRAVSLGGLKDLGAMSSVLVDKRAEAYVAGDRVGIFTVFENTFDEALLGDSDMHLDVRLSVHRALAPSGGQVLVTVTTVVRIHNLLGRLYMLPVKPMHRLIAPAVLAAAGRAQAD